MLRVAVVCCVVVASAVGVLACSSSQPAPVLDAGTDASPPLVVDAGAPDVQSFPFAQVCGPVDDMDVCRKCAIERCCETRQAILGNDAGMDLVSCNAAPGCGEACGASCFDQHPGQVRPYLDHYACMAHRCLSECASPVNACSACIDANCTLDNLACNLSAQCFLSTSCGAACARGDGACLKACAARYPEAAQLQTNLAICGKNRCPSECSGSL